MAESEGMGISERLWRLPAQFLLAMINATAILVIVAAIVAVVAIVRINHFAANVVATMTEAALSKVDLPPRDTLTNLRNLTVEVRTLGNTLREIKEENRPALKEEIAQVKGALNALSVSIDRLGSARSVLTDQAIERLGRTVADAVVKLRDCSSNIGQAGPFTSAETRQTVLRKP
ncbi:hypothetical protein ACVWXP_001960 [Bradyrhizobium sp. USDA 4463]